MEAPEGRMGVFERVKQESIEQETRKEYYTFHTHAFTYQLL